MFQENILKKKNEKKRKKKTKQKNARQSMLRQRTWPAVNVTECVPLTSYNSHLATHTAYNYGAGGGQSIDKDLNAGAMLDDHKG